MVETIIIAVVTEAVIVGLGLIATIPQIKKELKSLNENFVKANET